MVSVGKIYSTLGNSSSLIPLGIKDIANGTGMSIGSYITGDKIEGKDRFIDEFGTEAIWLLGIPFYKKAIDLLLYKPLNIDPNVDMRILKDPEIFKKAIEFAPNKEIQNSLQRIASNTKMAKGLAISKFIASTALTMVSYFGLTKFRHKYTENQIKKDYFAKQEKYQQNKNIQFSSKFDYVRNNKKSVSFTGGIQDFMFNPVKNLMIVDASITTERLTHARNKQDFVGYAIKEGSLWTFLYFAGAQIQKHLENNSLKKFNKSIALDARILENDEFKETFKNKSILKSISEFNKNKTDIEIYEFINKNSENQVIKAGKLSDIIPTLKKSDKVDTRKFIDIKEVKNLANEIEKLFTQYETSGEKLDIFMQKVRVLKRQSILKSIFSCITVLGIIVPAIMVTVRLFNKDKEFQTKKDIESKLSGQN